MLKRSIVLTLAAVAITFTAAPASALVYCRAVGVPRGCVARPVVRAPVVVAPRRAVTAPRPGNLNGGVNRVGRLR